MMQHETGSWIKGTLDLLASWFHQESGDGPFQEAQLLRNFVQPAIAEAFSRINLNRKDRVMVRFPITIVTGQTIYPLPPYIQHVWQLTVDSPEGRQLYDSRPRGVLNPFGYNWRIEANTLVLDREPTTGGNISLWISPGGNSWVHYSDDGGAVTTTTTFTLETTPDLGIYDKRTNAYVGQVIRVLGAGVWEDRVIVSQASNVVTVSVPFENSVGGSKRYEVVPMGSAQLWGLVAPIAAEKWAISMNSSQKILQRLSLETAQAFKTAHDNFNDLMARTGSAYDDQTLDSAELEFWGSVR